jgi:hypothetical protein
MVRLPRAGELGSSIEQNRGTGVRRQPQFFYSIRRRIGENNLRQGFIAFSKAHRADTVTDTLYDGRVKALEGWARIIEEKLSALPVRELFDEHGQPEGCLPECGAGWYEIILNVGVDIRNPDGTAARFVEPDSAQPQGPSRASPHDLMLNARASRDRNGTPSPQRLEAHISPSI